MRRDPFLGRRSQTRLFKRQTRRSSIQVHGPPTRLQTSVAVDRHTQIRMARPYHCRSVVCLSLFSKQLTYQGTTPRFCDLRLRRQEERSRAVRGRPRQRDNSDIRRNIWLWGRLRDDMRADETYSRLLRLQSR